MVSTLEKYIGKLSFRKFNTDLKAFQAPVVGIQDEFRQSNYLCCSVPPI
jgi:hypothetical protein